MVFMRMVLHFLLLGPNCSDHPSYCKNGNYLNVFWLCCESQAAFLPLGLAQEVLAPLAIPANFPTFQAGWSTSSVCTRFRVLFPGSLLWATSYQKLHVSEM